MSGVGAAAYLAPAAFVRSPEALGRPWPVEEGRAYTRWLATSHYENFHVVSFLLPKRLHQDFYNVYAYCRWSDDLADEIGDTAESLRLLAWWRGELDAMYAGRATHPVFAALAPTVAQYGIPRQPFSDLLDAFVQDQTVTRYRNWEELFGYCRNSANPVGRLVLYLGGYSDDARQRLSDATCTALQLANFWQDVTVDLLKDRVYIPLDDYGAAWLHAGGTLRAPLHTGLRSGDARNCRPGAGAFRRRAAACAHGGPALGNRPGPLQPRRHARAG